MKFSVIKKNIKDFESFIGKDTYRIFWIAAILGIFWFISETGFVFILQSFLQSLGLMNEVSGLIPSWIPKTVEFNLIVLIIYGFVKSLLLGLKLYMSGKLSQSFIAHKRAKIINYALQNAQEESVDQMFTLFTERTNQAAYLLDILFSFFNSTIATGLFLLFGLKYAPKEMLLGMFLLFVLLVPLKMLSNEINRRGIAANQEMDGLTELINNGMKNNFILRVYQIIGAEIKRGEALLNSYRQNYLGFWRINSIKNVVPNFLGVFVISIVTFFSVKYFSTDKTKLLAFYYIFIRAAQGASEANNFMSFFRLNYPAIRDLMELDKKIENNPIRTLEKKGPIAYSQISSIELKIRDLGFAYNNESNLFQNLNADVTRGDFLLIKGKSGTGKSTMLAIILGLLKPKEGQVLYNGEEIGGVTEKWFTHLGYIGPEPYLLRGSVRDNILYGHYDAKKVTDENIWSVLTSLDMHEIVKALPGQLDYVLNERAQLSTGQKQRLAIARALLRNPMILVLDEATSNLDSLTEQKIIEYLKLINRQVLIIAVTHKDSFDSMATKSIIMGKEIHG